MIIKRLKIISLIVVILGVFLGVVRADPTLVIVDSDGFVGEFSSLQLDGDIPVISYYDTSTGSLELARCADAACTSSTITTVDNTVDFVGQYTSLQLNGSDPVISYFDFVPNGDLKLVVCDDPNCTAETPIVLDSAGVVGLSTSLQLNGANPVITYYDFDNDNLKILICDDPVCTGDTPIVLVSGGQDYSLQLDAAGIPVIAYQDSVTADLNLLRCTDTACSSSTTVTLDTFAGRVSLQLDGAGNPIISYVASGDLVVLACDDPSCTGDAPVVIDDSSSYGFVSMQLDGSGIPVIAYHDILLGNLKVAVCDTLACANPTITTVDGLGDVGTQPSLQLNSSGYPVISHFDSLNFDLKLAVCDNATCSGGEYDFGVYSSDPTAGSALDLSGLANEPATATLTISNTGSAGSLLDVNVPTFGISNGFTIVDGLPIDGLAPDDPAIDIEIECMPDGFNEGTLTLVTSDPNQPTVTYDLFCAEVAPAIPGVMPSGSRPLQPTVAAPFVQPTEAPLAEITTLPATGETPIWRNWLLTVLVLGGITLSSVGVWAIRRQ